MGRLPLVNLLAITAAVGDASGDARVILMVQRPAARRGTRRYSDLSLATIAVASPIVLGFADSAVPPFGTLNWMVK